MSDVAGAGKPPSSKRGRMRVIDPGKGLHLLKDDFQKRYTTEQCDALVRQLDIAMDATLAAAPVRHEKYFRVRLTRKPSEPEAKWEQSMWEQWSQLNCDSVPGAWYRLIHYQTMLRATNKDRQWGEIDLLGVSHQGLPVVVELKAPRSSETPASLLVQAAAYALVLKKAWPVLAPEWSREVRRYGFDLSFKPPLAASPLVCAAPGDYWDNWIGQSPRARKVTRSDWAAFMRLVLAFAERGLPATFVRLDHQHQDECGIPRLIRATVLDPFVHPHIIGARQRGTSASPKP
jgi:hypothetical protein